MLLRKKLPIDVKISVYNAKNIMALGNYYTTLSGYFFSSFSFRFYGFTIAIHIVYKITAENP